MRVGVQFHGTPEEIIDFVTASMSEFRLYATLFWRAPAFRCEVWAEAAGFRAACAHEAPPEFIRLTLEPPVLPVDSENDFMRKNPEALLVDIGRLAADGLAESFIGARAEQPDTASAWRRIVSRWRKRTTAGAVAVNPQTGERAFIKGHHYTTGARESCERGVRMWALGKRSYYEIGVSR